MEGNGRRRRSVLAVAIASLAAAGCPPGAPADGPLLVTPPADPSRAAPLLSGAGPDDGGAGWADAATAETGSLVPSLDVEPQSAAPLPDDPSAMLEPLGASWKAPAPRRTAGRCWERYAALPDAALASARKEFLARNPGWRITNRDIDPFFGTARAAFHTLPAPAPASTRRVSATGAQQSAVVFARRNADLLGLVERDFEALDWNADGVPPRAAAPAQWRVSGESPSNAANSPFYELERRVRLDVYVMPDGDVERMNVRVVPQGSVCTEPGIRAEAAMRAAGVKAAGDDGVGDPARVVLAIRAGDLPSGHENRLVYRVPVQRPAATWVFVDAVSGKVFPPSAPPTRDP
jgi:hypothetical protein